MAEPLTVRLSAPIQAHGETVSELTLREPTLGMLDDVHLFVGSAGELRVNLGDLHRVVAGMAGIPPSAARAISLRDLGEIGPALAGFFGLSLGTGDG